MAVTVKGMPQLQARLKAIQDTRGLLGKVQIATVAEAKRLVPRKTGTTGRSIRPGPLNAREAFVLAGGAAAYLEEGTRPHVIRPRDKQVLRFPAAGVSKTLASRARTGEVRRLGSGAYVFAKEVHHPGTKPHPFMMPGAKLAVAKYGPDVMVGHWNKAA